MKLDTTSKKVTSNPKGIKAGLLGYGWTTLATSSILCLFMLPMSVGMVAIIASGKFDSLGEFIKLILASAFVWLLTVGILNLFIKSFKGLKTKKIIKQYIELIINQKRTSIEDLAKIRNVSLETAIFDIENLIKVGYFSKYKIDRQSMLLLTNQPPAIKNTMDTKSVVFKCNTCGANNSVMITANQVVCCEYCDVPQAA